MDLWILDSQEMMFPYISILYYVHVLPCNYFISMNHCTKHAHTSPYIISFKCVWVPTHYIWPQISRASYLTCLYAPAGQISIEFHARSYLSMHTQPDIHTCLDSWQGAVNLWGASRGSPASSSSGGWRRRCEHVEHVWHWDWIFEIYSNI